MGEMSTSQLVVAINAAFDVFVEEKGKMVNNDVEETESCHVGPLKSATVYLLFESFCSSLYDRTAR